MAFVLSNKSEYANKILSRKSSKNQFCGKQRRSVSWLLKEKFSWNYKNKNKIEIKRQNVKNKEMEQMYCNVDLFWQMSFSVL